MSPLALSHGVTSAAQRLDLSSYGCAQVCHGPLLEPSLPPRRVLLLWFLAHFQLLGSLCLGWSSTSYFISISVEFDLAVLALMRARHVQSCLWSLAFLVCSSCSWSGHPLWRLPGICGLLMPPIAFVYTFVVLYRPCLYCTCAVALLFCSGIASMAFPCPGLPFLLPWGGMFFRLDSDLPLDLRNPGGSLQPPRGSGGLPMGVPPAYAGVGF